MASAASGTWRPTHRAGAYVGCLVSNQESKDGLNSASYTFGHSSEAGETKATSQQDRAAAKWWGAGARPSTNDAANADIEAFWSNAATAGPAAAVVDLTGRNVAVAVKQAGRGTSVTLGFEGNAHTRSSKYRDDFCKGGAAGAAGTPLGPAHQYAAAKKAARANRALGTGASLNLGQEW